LTRAEAPWRREIRKVRRIIREARSARGRRRQALLVEAACIVATVATMEPRKDREAYRKAEWAVEVELGRLLHRCIGCVAMEADDWACPDLVDTAR
jgi:hypothetical protein